MYITPISEVNPKVNFKSNDYHDTPIEKTESKKSEKSKIIGYAAASALAAGTIAGIVLHKKYNGDLSFYRNMFDKNLKDAKKNYNRSIDDLRSTYESTFEENKTLTEKVKGLTADCEDLKSKNEELKKLAEDAKNKLDEIFEGDIAPKDLREKIYAKLKEKINKGDYGYDIKNPPITGKSGGLERNYDYIMPSSVSTNNRAGMIDLKIPEIGKDGRFEFELPMSDEVKITKAKTRDFKPDFNHTTSISESYADSVQWNNDKIARDIVQNFYDGHGQTLDGVKFVFTPSKDGKYKVRLEGKSTYTPDKAVYIGESTKRNDAKAAGNYGEGLKMSVLKLLRDSGASEVKIGSDNWKLNYTLAEGNLSDKRVLTYSLDKAEKFDGNYIEFETSDMELLQTLKKTINRFYHSNNKDFECPQFENALMGLKVLPTNERGAIYIAGQRFEFDNDYDGLKGVSLFIKEKLPLSILDPSRDRTSLNKSNLQSIARWISDDIRTTGQDKVKLLKSLDKYWDETNSNTPLDDFLESFLSNERFKFGRTKLAIKFPDKCVAYSQATPDVVMDLRMKGYRVCKSDFAAIGMPTIRDLLGDARKHDVVIPNDVQKKKILIIKEALKKLSPTLEGKHFEPEELDTKIFMFDKNAAKERTLYSDTQAEAITDKGVSKGFWIDKSYLDSSDFSEVLETALHELSHKAGGDESASFSYKLTDVNRDAIKQILEDTGSRNELNALRRIWNELSAK